MAKVTVEFPDDIVQKLASLETRTDAVLEKTLQAGADVVKLTLGVNDISTMDCTSFTNPSQMLEYTKMRLAEYAAPTVSYELSAMDLSLLTGYEHETWDLGDRVTVYDKELGIDVKTRVVRREYNLQEPWKSKLELSTTLKNLSSSSSTWDSAVAATEGTSLVSSVDIKDMVPFNHLKNSRADDGFAHWARVTVTNATGDLYLTDLMLQSGSIATGWTGHVSEIQFTQDG